MKKYVENLDVEIEEADEEVTTTETKSKKEEKLPDPVVLKTCVWWRNYADCCLCKQL